MYRPSQTPHLALSSERVATRAASGGDDRPRAEKPLSPPGEAAALVHVTCSLKSVPLYKAKLESSSTGSSFPAVNCRPVPLPVGSLDSSRIPLVRASSETAVCCQPRPGKREGNPGLCPRGAFRVGPDPRRRGHLLPAGARAARLERRGGHPAAVERRAAAGPATAPAGSGPSSERPRERPPLAQANPCPEVTDLTCRLPLPTLIYRPEAEHLGDLLRSKVLNNHHRPCGGGACPLDLHPTGIALLSAWSVRRAKREAHCGAAHNAAAPSSSSAGGSARDTKRLFARCSTANRWRSQQRGLLPTDHNLTYGCYGQRPPLKVNELGGLQQPKKEKKALPRATAGVGERVRLLPSTHTGLRTTGSKIRDSKGGWLPARPRTLFCSFFLFSKLSRKPWRWKPIVKPLDRPDPTTTSRVGGGRGRFFSTPVFRGGRGGAYSESEGEVVVHTVTVRGSPSPQAGETGEVGKRARKPSHRRGGREEDRDRREAILGLRADLSTTKRCWRGTLLRFGQRGFGLLEHLLLPPRSAPVAAPDRLAPYPSTLTTAPSYSPGPRDLLDAAHSAPGGRVSGGCLSAMPFSGLLASAVIRFTGWNSFDASASYPEGNFGGNQLLDSSIGLSPLYSALAIDLHVRNASDLHQGFPWLHPGQA
ncbi:hypothetical protein C7M84_018101 [Penaeus vannamei]|uniref:Uncharacterized protein n=1 Tax=Penaeus vannamei TaxID=6689 RepID=A0A3R7LV71_PENVA|nr:hypothetical protein C7M84_018101 [Penaeus vannamei]